MPRLINNADSWLILLFQWIAITLLTGGVWWLSDEAYSVHWLIGFPTRMIALVLSLAWIFGTLVMITTLALLVWHTASGLIVRERRPDV